MIYTTLRQVRELSPCIPGWKETLAQFNLKDTPDKPVDFLNILNKVGIRHTIWCLRTQDYRDYCLFLAAAADSVMPLFKKYCPEDPRLERVLNTVRDWHAGKANDYELKSAYHTATAVVRGVTHELMSGENSLKVGAAYAVACAVRGAADRATCDPSEATDSVVYAVAYDAHGEAAGYEEAADEATDATQASGEGSPGAGPAYAAAVTQWAVLDTLLRSHLR